MDNNVSFPKDQLLATQLIAAPFIIPTAQILPGSAGLNAYGLIQDVELLPMEQPDRYTGDNGLPQYDLQDPLQSYGNVHDQQFQPDWYLPRQPEYLEPSSLQLPDANLASSTLAYFTDGYFFSPVEVFPSHDNGFPTPSPDRPDNGNTVNVLKDAESLDAVDAVDSSLVDKEKQARAVLKKQRSQNSVAKHMGESVDIVQTETGIQIGGVYWSAPANHGTIRQSPAEINTRIDALTIAIQNKEDCREKTTTGQFRNRWSAGSTYYSEECRSRGQRRKRVCA